MNKIGVVDSLEQAEVTDDGLIDVLHVAVFVLECIVANPVLYDRKNERHHDEMFKLKVWNEICRVFHDKGKETLTSNLSENYTFLLIFGMN